MNLFVRLDLSAREAAQAVARGDVIIVIDVLRCTSSMINALANGAERIIPVKTLREAYDLKSKYPNYLLAGEREGRKPRGFDFGNSPLEFTGEKVQGETLIFTTTSGTAALSRCKNAERVFIASFLNVSSVASEVEKIALKEKREISIIPSGQKGKFSLEDFLCGGAIAERLARRNAALSDSAVASLLSFQKAKDSLLNHIMMGKHAQNLVRMGFGEDVRFCCQVDIYDVAPSIKKGVVTL